MYHSDDQLTRTWSTNNLQKMQLSFMQASNLTDIYHSHDQKFIIHQTLDIIPCICLCLCLSVSCSGTAAVVDIECEPKHVLFVCFDCFSPLYICVVCLCFLFVCLCFCIWWRCLLAHRLNTLAIDPPRRRRTVVGTHCEFHLCVNKFWLALAGRRRRRRIGGGQGGTAHRH